MTTRTSVRPAVQAAIAAALQADASVPDGIVMDGAVPRDAGREVIVVGDPRSIEAGILFMQSGRKERKDLFGITIEFYAHAPNQQTPAEARQRAAVLFTSLENLLADRATLMSLQRIQITSYDGPTSYPLEGGGFGSKITATVECLSQLF